MKKQRNNSTAGHEETETGSLIMGGETPITHFTGETRAKSADGHKSQREKEIKTFGGQASRSEDAKSWL